MAGEELQLEIIDYVRLNAGGTFQRHNLGLLSLKPPELMCFYPLCGPYVVIRYRLAIMENTLGEIWRCEMVPSAHGFSINNGEYFIRVHVSPHGLVRFDTQDHGFRQLHGSTGVVTLLLPSLRPQLFDTTVKLISATRGRHRCVSYRHQEVSVPGPQLEEYQEGPGIDKAIKKIRPTGMWNKVAGMEIVKKLQRLADDGRRDLFMETLERLETAADSDLRLKDIIPLALYELAMLDLHENRIEEAEQHKMKAFEITKTYQLTNDRFLLCKLKYIESALARRMGNYSKAKELLEDSVELLLPCAAGEETAENRYFFASYYVEKAAKVGITDQEQTIAERCFQDVDRHLDAETRSITSRFQIRSKNRQVAFYVKSSRHVKNLDVQRVVSEEHMTKAFQLIWEIENDLLKFYPKKPMMSFQIIKTDYYIRRGSLELGIEPSREALKIAKEKGWNEYVEVAHQRLQLCRAGLPLQCTGTFV